MKKFLDIIKDKKKENRPVCFFTLNDTLTKEGIRSTVKQLEEGGFGGAYIHCRSGYTGEYLTEEWFEKCDELIDYMLECNLEPWVYDEFGWPSGIAGGCVLKGNKDFCQHWLVKNDNPTQKKGEVIGYYSEDCKLVDRAEVAFFSLESVVNSSYVDVLNRQATDKFIEETYEKYRLRYGEKIKGFFTDEPQFGLEHAPWNKQIELYLEKKYGAYKQLLPYLYIEDGGEDFRQDFNKKVAEMFVANYIKPISDWCGKFGYSLTGHILEEKELWLQVPSAGDVMDIYKNMQAPAVDWLGADIGDMKTPKQLSSVCQRYGKKRSVTESFALIGYGASFDIMKNIVDWQIAGGVSNICNVMGYSLRGRRKRDYPAGTAFVQPYYPKLNIYNDYLAKLCSIPAEMQEVADVLLIEPLYECMKNYVYGRRFNVTDGCLEISKEYNDAIDYLTQNNILFHIASPSELAFASVENGCLKLGDYVYNSVLSLDSYTDKMLDGIGIQYQKNPHIAKKRLFLHGVDSGVYTSVYNYGEGYAIMLKNLTDKDILIDGVVFDDQYVKTEVDFVGMMLLNTNNVYLPAKGLKVLLTGENGEVDSDCNDGRVVDIDNDGFSYFPLEKNLLTLDFCNYETTVDRGRASIINLFEKLVASAYKGKLKMEFSFDNHGIADTQAELLVETAELFDVTFNGKKVVFNGNSGNIDIKDGINTVVLSCDYHQDERSRKILNGEAGLEVDFNMLGKLFELENVYIRGNFGVFADEIKDCGCNVEVKEFYIKEAKKLGPCNYAVANGYPYYTGVMCYEKQIEVKPGERFIKMKNLCGAADVFIDGSLIKTVLWNEGKILLPKGLSGKHVLRIDHYNTIRNAIGPNHNIYDEGIMVGYTTFSGTPGWCDKPGRNMWTDTYRLTRYGVDFD